WTISAATSCCRGRWPDAAYWAPPLPSSGSGSGLAGGRRMAAESKRPPADTGGDKPRTGTHRTKACCLVSEVLEEAGLDRTHIRAIRRQVLQGLMLFCQWQLERMERPR